MIIAIDGPAGAGKSTVAGQLADRLGFEMLDTGAMYRAVAWAALENDLDLDDHPTVAALAEQLDIQMEGPRIRVNGRDVTQAIRTPTIGESASKVAAIPQVRRVLVDLQRTLAATGDFVCEGRDQGTVVFPHADFKFFVTASVSERARRRFDELKPLNPQLTLDEVNAELSQRDRRDATRTVGPLTQAPDAIEIVTDTLDIAEVTEMLLKLVEENSDRKRRK